MYNIGWYAFTLGYVVWFQNLRPEIDSISNSK